MQSNFPSLKSIMVAAILSVASLASSASAFGGESSVAANKAFYRHQIQNQITICQAKSTLQLSYFKNVRELGHKYALKLAYLTRQQDQLVAEMANNDIDAKSYRVSRYITADFHRTLERYNLAQR